jgi:hypothetical protein
VVVGEVLTNVAMVEIERCHKDDVAAMWAPFYRRSKATLAQRSLVSYTDSTGDSFALIILPSTACESMILREQMTLVCSRRSGFVRMPMESRNYASLHWFETHLRRRS